MVELHRGPVGSDVAIITGVGTCDMSGRLSGCGGPIVATRASAGDGGVVELHGGPVGGDVAVVTGVGTRDVSGRFSGCRSSVVTGGAGSGD